jgi:hypothetical protein
VIADHQQLELGDELEEVLAHEPGSDLVAASQGFQLALGPAAALFGLDGGHDARAAQADDAENTIASVKRFMGRRLADVADAGRLPYRFVDQPGMVAIDTRAGIKTPVFFVAGSVDSTSGYAVPLYNLVQQGYDPETFFSGIPFSGSHEAGVQGVVNKQFDAAATYQDNETSGVYQLMVTKGMIKEGEVCVIWQSPEITNGPITTRNNLPQPMIDEVKAALLALPTAAPEVYKEMTGGETSTDKGYIEVNHERYQWIIDMRAWRSVSKGQRICTWRTCRMFTS